MMILHRYIFTQFMRNTLLMLGVLIILFLLIDVTDRLDTILAEDASLWTAVQYFALKIPYTVVMMLPISVLGGCLLTFALLHKNSELIAMRCAGAPVLWLARPMLIMSFVISLTSIVISETVVPASQRILRKIYNLDIQQKDKKGVYSQKDIWWRTGDSFYSAAWFDSRSNRLMGVSALRLSSDFKPRSRVVAKEARWMGKDMGWDLRNASLYTFRRQQSPESTLHDRIPIPVKKPPKEFFDAKTETDTLSFRELTEFINRQSANGIPVRGYQADLYEKLAFPFVSFIMVFISCAFAVRTVRSTNLAVTFLMGLGVAFIYFAVHSFSVALGRAELLPPFIAAWVANILLLSVGAVLNSGSEAPR